MKRALQVPSFLAFLALVVVAVIPVVRFGERLLSPVVAQAYAGRGLGFETNSISPAPALWISPAVPPALRQSSQSWDIPLAEDAASASLRLDVRTGSAPGATWVYVLVAPFPTVIEGVTLRELLANWQGTPAGPFAGRPLLMDEHSRSAMTALWGAPAPGALRIVPADQMLDAAWKERPSWAIIPFEELDPRWKVLSVNGLSPIWKDFEVSRFVLMQTSFDYPLAVTFSLSCSKPCPYPALPVLPPTNRDPSKLTTLITTGVTALVRATAYTMNAKGVTYPGRDIQSWLAQADITHISNEIPFFDECPEPKPVQANLVFCSDPRDIELLKYVGMDVVELTGNHYADYGPAAMLQTLELYNENHISYYGGGANLEDARKPLLLTDHGNRFAFIGCNSVDVGRKPTASSDRPGAAPCDYDYMTQQIRRLHDAGYLVIVSFQYYETYVPRPFDAQVHDFRLMADAGATLVQGSQAHVPQTMEFYDQAFIHYGLGNLFFDQMGITAGAATRREFIDRHVFYAARHISTELLTAMLEDYARPRPMTPQERAAFLAEYFAASGW